LTSSILTCVLLVSVLSASVVGAEPKPGDTLGQANWQEARGLLPDAVLLRFQDGSYQAKLSPPPEKLGWSRKFTSASEANAGKFSVDAESSLIEVATQAYPVFLYGYPFPQINATDPQAAAKIMYNFSYTLMQTDDVARSSNLHWVVPAALERSAEFEEQFLFMGSRFSGPVVDREATLRRGLIAGFSPQDIFGVMILEWVYLDPKRWNSLWMYTPELRRVRQVPSSDGSDDLFGSDLAHDDPYLFSGKVQYFTWKLVGVQEALVPYTLPNPKLLHRAEQGYRFENPGDFLIMGWEKEGWKGKAWWPTTCSLVKRPVWVVEATANDPQYAYRRQILWIDRELYVAYYKEAYDRAGQLWRTLLNAVSIAQSPEGDLSVAQPDFTLSVDEQQNHATVESPRKEEQHLTYNVGLAEKAFTTMGLQKRAK
jgi:hypothetical protein